MSIKNFLKNLKIIFLFPPVFCFAAETKVALPRWLIWSDTLYVNPAGYFLEIEKDGKPYKKIMVTQSEYFLDPKEEGVFSWRVRACPDFCENENCLENQCSKVLGQETFYGCLLSPPQLITSDYEPPSGSNFLPEDEITLKINQNVSIKCQNEEVYYQFELKGPIGENCKEEKVLLPKPTEGTTTKEISLEKFKKDKKNGKDVFCLGTYYWRVRGCIDKYCQESGTWGPSLYFVVGKTRLRPPGLPPSSSEEIKFGFCSQIIPCRDRPCDFPEDLLKLLANLLNCFTWTLTPISILFALVYTGIVLYTGARNPDVYIRLKTIWRNLGLGWFFIFFSWTILNFFLKIIGWRIGSWFQPLK